MKDKDLFKKLDWQMFAVSIVAIVLGFLFILFPDQAFSILCYLLGVALLVLGIVNIARYCRQPDGFQLTVGIVCIGFGIYLMTSPGLLLNLFLQLLGVVMIVGGVLKFQYAVESFRARFGGWWLFLIFAALAVILGILLVTKVLDSTALVIFCGVALLINGIFDLIITYILAKNTSIGPFKG